MSPTAPITHGFYTCGCLHVPSPSSPSPSSTPSSHPSPSSTSPSTTPRPNGTHTRTRRLPTPCPTHHATEPPKTWWAECIAAEELAEAAWRERAKARARELVEGGEPAVVCPDTSSAEKTGDGEIEGNEGDGEDVRREGGEKDEVGGEKDAGAVKEEKEGEEGVVWQGRGGSEMVVPVGRRVLQRRKVGRGAKRERC